MGKAIFTAKISPAYDDLPEERYHFPCTYLNQVRQALGDWIIYYEPRRQDSDPSGRAGRQTYFAVARLLEVIEDSPTPGHFYARVGDYLEFDDPVPFREGEHYYELGLKKTDGSTNKGAFGRAVRPISDQEFEAIFRSGFIQPLDTDHEILDTSQPHPFSGLSEPEAVFARPLVEQLVKRPFRDAAFAKLINSAYDSTPAFTGIRLINGGGRREIEAAHIRPVGEGHNGPDSTRNGVAICRTVHWMFDRGLVSIADDYQILMAEKLIPENIRSIFNPDGFTHVPQSSYLQPHPTFLSYHRENIFKG